MLRRARPILALDHDSASRLLAWIIGLTVMLAMVALAGALLINALTRRWSTGLATTLTVEIDPPAGSTAPPAATVARAVALLHGVPGVITAAPIGAADTRRLLQPWLGDAALAASLPLPVLISVTMAADGDRHGMATALATIPEAQVDDHAAWLSSLLTMARLAQVLATGVIIIVGATVIVAVVLATRSGLAAHRPTIELLHLMGATDRQIARQFQDHAALLALRGAAGGAVATALLLTALDVVVRLHDLPVAAPGLGVFAWTLLGTGVPVAATAAAAVTARWTVLRALERLP